MGVSRIGYKVFHFIIPKIITMEHSQRRSTCKIKSDPNYIPQTFHSGTILAQSKFDKRACSEFACQFACQFACSEPAAVWFQIKAFSRPNLRAKLVLQVYGQKWLDRKTTALKIWHLQKLDNSKTWQLQNLTAPQCLRCNTQRAAWTICSPIFQT